MRTISLRDGDRWIRVPASIAEALGYEHGAAVLHGDATTLRIASCRADMELREEDDMTRIADQIRQMQAESATAAADDAAQAEGQPWPERELTPEERAVWKAETDLALAREEIEDLTDENADLRATLESSEFGRMMCVVKLRARTALKVLAGECYCDFEVKQAANKALMEILSSDDVETEEEEDGDKAPEPENGGLFFLVPVGMNEDFEGKTRGGFPVLNFYESTDPDDKSLYGEIDANGLIARVSWNEKGFFAGIPHPYDLIPRRPAEAPASPEPAPDNIDF